VDVLAASDRALAERFSEIRPRSVARLIAWRAPSRHACRLAGSTPVGYAQLVEGVIDQLELHDLEDPLAYLHGYYRAVGHLPYQG
jgi:hypothetical protein